AQTVMFFRCYHTTCFLNRLQYSLRVKRLNRMDVDDLGVNSKFSKFFTCKDRFPNQMAGSKNTDILTFIYHPCLANLELLIRVSKNGNNRTAKSQVNRAFKFRNRFSSSLSLVIVTRIDNSHTRKHLHHTDI